MRHSHENISRDFCHSYAWNCPVNAAINRGGERQEFYDKGSYRRIRDEHYYAADLLMVLLSISGLFYFLKSADSSGDEFFNGGRYRCNSISDYMSSACSSFYMVC